MNSFKRLNRRKRRKRKRLSRDTSHYKQMNSQWAGKLDRNANTTKIVKQAESSEENEDDLEEPRNLTHSSGPQNDFPVIDAYLEKENEKQIETFSDSILSWEEYKRLMETNRAKGLARGVLSSFGPQKPLHHECNKDFRWQHLGQRR